jgi:hypothetical protein
LKEAVGLKELLYANMLGIFWNKRVELWQKRTLIQYHKIEA